MAVTDEKKFSQILMQFKLKVGILHQSNEQIDRLFVDTIGSVYMSGNNVNTMERVVNKSHLEYLI